MKQKYTALPAFPFIISSSRSTSYVVVGADSHGRSTLVPLEGADSRKELPLYKNNLTLDRILEVLNEGTFTLTMNAPQEEDIPETPVAKATTLDPLVIRVDTTEAERALGILTELEASVTRVKALFA